MYIYVYWNIYINRYIIYNRYVVFLFLVFICICGLVIYLYNLEYLVVRYNICLCMYVFILCYRIEFGKFEFKELLNGLCLKCS